MKNTEKEAKAKVNALAESAEEVSKIVTDGYLSGSKIIRTSVLGTTEEEKDTLGGIAKDTLSMAVETAETISGAIAENLLQGSKNIRKRLLEDEETPDCKKLTDSNS